LPGQTLYACMPGKVGLPHTALGINEYMDSFQAARAEHQIGRGNRIGATVHTHGDYATNSAEFSNADANVAHVRGLDSYLGTPTGQMRLLRAHYPPQAGITLRQLPYNKAYTYIYP
jgi:hypothetical protein